jgi:hypothetical protein
MPNGFFPVPTGDRLRSLIAGAGFREMARRLDGVPHRPWRIYRRFGHWLGAQYQTQHEAKSPKLQHAKSMIS